MTRFKFLSDNWGFFSEPFELLLAAVQVLSGVLYLIGTNKPGPLEIQLPPGELRAWIIGYTLGGALVVVSRILLAAALNERVLEMGSRVEALGMTIGGSAIAMYAMSIYALGLSAFVSGSILAAWSGASFLRLFAIQRQWAPYRKARNRKGSVDV